MTPVSSFATAFGPAQVTRPSVRGPSMTDGSMTTEPLADFSQSASSRTASVIPSEVQSRWRRSFTFDPSSSYAMAGGSP